MSTEVTTPASNKLQDYLQSLLENVSSNGRTLTKPEVSLLSAHLDNLIRIGVEDASGTFIKADAVEVKVALTNLARTNHDMRQSLQRLAQEKYNLHVHHADARIPEQFARHCNSLNEVCSLIDEAVLGTTAETPTDYSRREVEYKFYLKLHDIGQEIEDLTGQEKLEKFRELTSEAALEIGQEYGQTALENLSNSIKDSSAIAFAYSRTGGSGLPDLGSEDELKSKQILKSILDFKNGNFSSLGKTDDAIQQSKSRVISLINEIADNKGQIKGNLDLELKASRLTDAEKAYYSYLQEGVEGIKQVASKPGDLLKSFTGSLPDMLAPALIGAVVGYLVGGMEVAFGIGAVAANFIMPHLSRDGTASAKPKPPEFTRQQAV